MSIPSDMAVLRAPPKDFDPQSFENPKPTGNLYPSGEPDSDIAPGGMLLDPDALPSPNDFVFEKTPSKESIGAENPTEGMQSAYSEYAADDSATLLNQISMLLKKFLEMSGMGGEQEGQTDTGADAGVAAGAVAGGFGEGISSDPMQNAVNAEKAAFLTS